MGARPCALLEAFQGRTMVADLEPRLFEDLRVVRVPGDGSCFYTSAVCSAWVGQSGQLPRLAQARGAATWLRNATAAGLRRDAALRAFLGEAGACPDAYADEVAGGAQADEPAICAAADVLRLPVVVLEEAGGSVKAYLAGARHARPGRTPATLLRSGAGTPAAHYDALVPRGTRRKDD